MDCRAMSLYFPLPEECSRHEIFPGVAISTCSADKMMLSHVEIQPFATVLEHQHPHEQVGMVLDGTAVFYIGNEEKLMRKGDMYRSPGNVKHRVVAQEQGLKALDIFFPIREDYR
jgi:quercetin dioxygenase-like cupin family protein